MQETSENTTLEANRPKFLTVLCIISFVLVGISVAVLLTQYFELAKQAKSLSNFGNSSKNGFAAAFGALAESFGVDVEKLATSALIQALINIPILIGVLLMWKRNKIGFYVYVAFQLIQPIVPLLMGIELLGDMMTMAVWGVIIGVVFTVLYALNLKHMSN